MEDYTESYAKYYDLLTRHKSYGNEVNRLVQFLNQEGFGVQDKVLSVGCGIGAHEKLLAAHFKKVTGVDNSTHMITYGQKINKTENLTLTDKALDDLDEQHFDVVISLFNVANCIGGIRDLVRFFRSVASKMRPEGLLVFEIWNATDTILFPPQIVERRYEAGNTYLKRVAKPVLDAHQGLLRLEYDITGQEGGEPVALSSIHNVYLYACNVIEYCLEEASFETVSWFSALSEGMNPAVDNDRMLLCCARKRAS